MTDNRYAHLPIVRRTLPDGSVVVVRARRIVPPESAVRSSAGTIVGVGDRADLLASRTLGDPTAWWRLCDANDLMSPAELEQRLGETVRVPDPGTTMTP